MKTNALDFVLGAILSHMVEGKRLHLGTLY